MKNQKILFIIGTRPELIKVFPLINYLSQIGNRNYRVLATGQHQSLLQKYWKLFGIEADYNLSVMTKKQSLAALTAKTITQIDSLINNITTEFKPSTIVAQGDTTTVMAASMVAFYNNIRYAHIEAGLRSHDLQHPFPEEFNRKVASVVADLHFAPTALAKENLLREGVEKEKVHQVGNTVIDTLHYFINNGQLQQHNFIENQLSSLKSNCVLITCHRRENHSALENLVQAIKHLAKEEPDTTFVWATHPNPKVHGFIANSDLKEENNVLIVNPLEYLDLLKVMSMSKMILTDSGGIQEEAPTFKVPVLVMREKTERPEAVDMGVSKLVGMSKAKIIDAYFSFNPSFGKNFESPYGDGKASERILKLL